MSSEQHSKYTELHQKLDKLKSDFRINYAKNIKIDESQMEQRTREDGALIDKDRLRIDGKPLEELSRDFWQVIKDYSDLSSQDGRERKIDIKELTRLVLAGDLEGVKLLAHQLKMEDGLLLFLGSNLAQALLGAYAYKLQSKAKDDWLKGYCPICGGSPCMEKFSKEEEGKRILRCGFCGTEWAYRRLMCPFCGNDDHNSLRYFFVEKDSPYRVDVCDKCKRYVKGVDERKIPEGTEIDLSFENINTLYLDVLAQKDGYQNPAFWMAGLIEEELI